MFLEVKFSVYLNRHVFVMKVCRIRTILDAVSKVMFTYYGAVSL